MTYVPILPAPGTPNTKQRIGVRIDFDALDLDRRLAAVKTNFIQGAYCIDASPGKFFRNSDPIQEDRRHQFILEQQVSSKRKRLPILLNGMLTQPSQRKNTETACPPRTGRGSELE
jgi:hypothetical protein